MTSNSQLLTFNSQLPKGWTEIVLEDACNVEYGTRVVKKRDGGMIYPVYGGGGATFFMDSTNRKDCLVVARFAMSEQCTRFVKGAFFLNDSGLTVQSKDTNKIIQKFLDLQFIYLNDHIYSLSRGAAQKNLNVPAFRKIILKYPSSLPEQQRIVKILDKAFVAIDKAKQNAEQNLSNAKEVFENYLQEVFENKENAGEEKKLGEVVSEMMTGPFGSMLHKSDYVENGIPVINPQNIINSKIIPLQKTMISKDTFKRLEKYALRENDIIIARRGEMGRCAIVEKENTGWLCGTGSLVIRVNKKKTDERYLTFYLSSSKVKKQLENSSIGATMNNLNQKVLLGLNLVLLSIQKQKVAIKTINTLSGEIKSLDAIYKQKIANLVELKKSILQKAFRGAL